MLLCYFDLLGRHIGLQHDVEPTISLYSIHSILAISRECRRMSVRISKMFRRFKVLAIFFCQSAVLSSFFNKNNIHSRAKMLEFGILIISLLNNQKLTNPFRFEKREFTQNDKIIMRVLYILI